MAAVGVGAIGAKSSDLGNGVARRRVGGIFLGRGLVEGLIGYENYAKVSANGEGPWKQVEHHVGSSGGGHVVVHRIAAKEEIAHATAGEVGFVTFRAQSLDDA